MCILGIWIGIEGDRERWKEKPDEGERKRDREKQSDPQREKHKRKRRQEKRGKTETSDWHGELDIKKINHVFVVPSQYRLYIMKNKECVI